METEITGKHAGLPLSEKDLKEHLKAFSVMENLQIIMQKSKKK
jgi:hypothetical protein